MPDKVQLHINGNTRAVQADPDQSLLSVLRDDLDMTGTHYGCGQGQCGACTVLIDGKPTRSCITPVSAVGKAQVLTIEGLEKEGRLHPVQQAFLDNDALQCGYCTSGMIMSAVGLLRRNPHPTEQQITQGMNGNVCRCGTYRRILRAVKAAAQTQAKDAQNAVRWDERRNAMSRHLRTLDKLGIDIADGNPNGNSPIPQEYDQAVQSVNNKRESGLNRRDLFRLLGAGLVMLVAVSDAEAQESGGGGRRRPDATPQNIGAWLYIDAQGQVTVYTGKTEVGQNARTSLTQCVAEELRVPVSAIQVIMADTALTPYDFGTVGSRTTPSMVPQLRKAAAAARELVIGLAAAQWQTDRASLTAAEGKVHHAATNQSLTYGELLKGQKLSQTIPADIALTAPADWKIMGTSVPKVDGRAFVTGRHRYTSDVKRADMLYGKILRPAAFHATLKSLDASAAKAMPSVTVVQDGDFVGVVASSPKDAAKALAALQAEWQTVPQPSGQTLYAQLRPATAPAANGEAGKAQPAAPAASIGAGNHKIQATYTVAYIAHAPLEPRAALAEWKDNQLTVWTGTQRPFSVRGELAAALHISEDNIRVIVPDTGSGYGGKHTGEVAVEAARLSRAAGKPVKLVWTREEEFTWAYFRPAGVIDVSGDLNPDGTLAAWEMHNYNSGPSGIQCPYETPNPVTQFHRAQAPLREGSYRGLAATANHFARESHIDDLAHAAKMNPLAFRLKNLKDERMRNVLLAAAARFGWDTLHSSPSRGYGIACGTEKGSYVANCVEVTLDKASGRVQVTRIVTAFECGAIVNPTHLQNQVEGAVVQGLGGALFEAIRFDEGKILNPHFAAYRVPRFADVPPLDVVLLDRKDLPSQGAGETPIVSIAPAIGNAIFAATGQRLRAMPLVPNGLKV